MQTLIGISGSLRRHSFNTALLQAAALQLPSGYALRISSIRPLPLFDADLEQQGMPEAALQLKSQLMEAHGLLISTPEYNSSFPGVLKNAIDWISRPAADIPRVFGGLPVAIMGVTTGALATASAQTALLPVLRSLRMIIYTDRQLRVPYAAKAFDQAGILTDTDLESRLGSFMRGFCAFADQVSVRNRNGSTE